MIGAPYFLIAAVLVAGIAAVIDWKTGQIPNWLTFGTLAVAPLGHIGVSIASGHSGIALTRAGLSIAGAVICALVPLLLRRVDAIGGGDVKLFAALGALLLPLVGIEAELYSFVAGMLYAPARMAYEGKLMRTIGNSLTLMLNPLRPKSKRKKIPRELMTKMRFGPAIFFGTLAVVIIRWRAV